MIPYPSALLHFAFLYSQLPFSVQAFIGTFFVLSLGIPILKFIYESVR